MNDRDIDQIFERSAPREVDPAVLRRVSSSIAASLRPVRPMAPAWMLALALLSIAMGVAFACAWFLGMYGIRNLGVQEIGAIFPILAIVTWLAALRSVAAMTPGGLRWKNPTIMEPVMTNSAVLLLVIVILWVAIDAIFFRDYEMDSFVQQGWPCLRAGLVVAVPAGAAGWLVLRRGFAVDPPSVGLAAGTLAGLAGLTMLELHCPNFRAMHVMVWHTAAIPISALAGILLGKLR